MTSTELKNWIALAVGLAAVVGFALFIRYLLLQVGATDQQWSRMLYVYGGVEAVAFAALGHLFGQKVHRERAESAERRADEAQGRAETASEERARAEMRFKSVAAVVESKAEGRRAAEDDEHWSELTGIVQRMARTD